MSYHFYVATISQRFASECENILFISYKNRQLLAALLRGNFYLKPGDDSIQLITRDSMYRYYYTIYFASSSSRASFFSISESNKTKKNIGLFRSHSWEDSIIYDEARAFVTNNVNEYRVTQFDISLV